MTTLHTISKYINSLGKPKRSAMWSSVEKKHKVEQPYCMACGCINQLQVHHIQPFHLYPALELMGSNLITLCEGVKECHLKLGHLGNWKNYNPNVINDAATALANSKMMLFNHP